MAGVVSFEGAIQSESDETTSPPATVPRARQVRPLMVSFMNFTLPSPKRALTRMARGIL